MKTYEITQCRQGFLVRTAKDYNTMEVQEMYCFSTFNEAVEFIAKRFGI